MLLSLHLPQVLELPKETFITALHWYPSQSGGAKRGGALELCALGTTSGEERRGGAEGEGRKRKGVEGEGREGKDVEGEGKEGKDVEGEGREGKGVEGRGKEARGEGRGGEETKGPTYV